MNQRLRIAIQKKGRLYEESLTLLQGCGLQFRLKNNSLLTHVNNFPIDLLFVRDDDIPTMLFDDLCDAGIVGENTLYEAALTRNTPAYETIIKLDACHCRLAIAVPEQFDYMGPSSLTGKRIATSYPRLLNHYLTVKGVNSECVVLSGSVEVAPKMGMADVICDLVSSGDTLEENKLREVDVVLESQATFIQSIHSFSEKKNALLQMLSRRMQAILHARTRKYILFHAPQKSLDMICQTLPGAESPTILALPNQPGKVAVHVVSSEEVFWDTLENLQSMGASSILVLPIEKMLE